MNSPKYRLNKKDILKVGKGALIAAGASGAIYLLEAVPNFDFGVYTALAVAMSAVFINFFRKLLANGE